jgi:DNA repair protein RecO (recombination protein O)
MAEREQVLLEHAFVLHQRPYRDSSQLLECMTATHGRVGLVARGSRRAGSRQRALLQPFVPLRVSWVRRGELGRLIGVESIGQTYALAGHGLLGGFYMNELLLRLTARGDPNAEAFSCYSRRLALLTQPKRLARELRFFELELLHALGYGLELDGDAETGEPLKAECSYVYELERGLRRADDVDAVADADVYSGRDLVSLRDRVLDDDGSLRAAQRLLGKALKAHLGERPIRSRLVLQDIVSRGL